MYYMLQKSTRQKILEIFYRNPTTNHYLKQISRDAQIAHTSVKKHLEELEKKNLITKTIIKQASRNYPHYQANLENKEFKQLKRLNNQKNIVDSGLIDHIYQTCYPTTIILFGSYARGEDTENSDIDLYVQSINQEIKTKSYEKILNRKIHLHFQKSFNKYPKELKNNIINGITVQGALEPFK